MARPTPARFYVNSGIVSSRTDMLNLLRPLIKQTVSYRYYRGRDLVAIGTGWVERVVIDEPETSSYFTPVSICLNVDSPSSRVTSGLSWSSRCSARVRPGSLSSWRSTRAGLSRWSSWARRPTRAPERRRQHAGRRPRRSRAPLRMRRPYAPRSPRT